MKNDSIEARHINQLNDAVNKIETELGTNPKGSYSSIKTALENMVAKTGDQTVAGVKTFSSYPNVPAEAPTVSTQAASKGYVDAVLPPQSGQEGKFLTTNGTAVSWAPTGGGSVTAVTADSPLASSGGTTPNITIQDGTTAQKGAIQLQDSLDTTTTKTATPNIVNTVYAALSTHISNTNNPHSVTSTQVLPSQSGNIGKFLTTDGSAVSWDSTSIGSNDGWNSVLASWSYASATTITVPSGAASIYQTGDKIKFTQNATVKYFYVVGVADTVLTVTGGSDYSVANAAISAISYSKIENPQGFPAWFNWTPTITCSGSMTYTNLTTAFYKFKISGGQISYIISTVGTIANASTVISFSSPVTSSSVPSGVWLCVAGTYVGSTEVTGLSGYKDGNIIFIRESGTAFTNGTRKFSICGFYPI